MGVFSGPNVVEDTDYLYHVCTSSGTFIPSFSGTVEYLVVAGGGGGGMDMGGGGGGGGVLASTVSVTAGTSYTVTVGAGGAGAPAGNVGGNPNFHQFTVAATQGSNSVFGAVTATGGGFGGSSVNGYTPGPNGGNGGSGGGASGYGSGQVGGTGTGGQGNRGGNNGGAYYSGGGGGAGAAGTDGASTPNGGAGILNTILGLNYYWAGGGGGASYSSGVGGNGGIGGGGGGSSGGIGGIGLNTGMNAGLGGGGDWVGSPGGAGGRNTGGGGGGGMHYNRNNQGGNGGSGIVVIRYLKSLGQSAFSGSPAYPLNSIIFSMDAANVGKGFAVECLVVAGGGGGGMDMGGGGGAGQAFQKSFSVTLGVSYPVTVGAGGAGSPGSYAGPPASGSTGNPSSFGDIFLFGGGGGGSGHYFPYPYPSLSRQGQTGGGEDGGNAGGDSPCWGRNRGSGQTSSFGGYNGGSAGYNGDGSYTAGGGGGAASPGEGGRGTWRAGTGGIGLLSAINGTSLYWGGGGGGSGWTNSAGAGGAGGGGGGSCHETGTLGSGGAGLNAGGNGTAATGAAGGNGGANTGGGGGGGTHAYSVGGNGGSGIVIIRYYGSQKATGGTITSASGYTVHTFTSSGTFTPTDNIGAADMSQLNTTLIPANTERTTTAGGAFSFNGSSSIINVPNMDLRCNWTMEIWFRTSNSNVHHLFGHGITAANQGLHITGGTTTRFGMYANDTDFPSNPATNVWQCYVFTYQHTAPYTKQMFINGFSVAGTAAGGPAEYTAAPGNFRVGATYGSGSYGVHQGEIAVAKMYTRVLSAEEIFQNFCAMRGRFGI